MMHCPLLRILETRLLEDCLLSCVCTSVWRFETWSQQSLEVEAEPNKHTLNIHLWIFVVKGGYRRRNYNLPASHKQYTPQ